MARETLNTFEGSDPYSLNFEWSRKVRTHKIMESATPGGVLFNNGGLELKIPDIREPQIAVVRAAVHKHNEAHDQSEQKGEESPSVNETNEGLPTELQDH